METNNGVYADENATGTDPLNADSDGDGLLDGVEDNSGLIQAALTGTNPNLRDSDGDRFPDGYELAECSDPNLTVPMSRAWPGAGRVLELDRAS